MKERHKIKCASFLFLLRGSEILLARRFQTGYEDGKYGVPAGHVDKGEFISDALAREVKEEIGIDLDLEGVELAHVMHLAEGGINDEFVYLFFTCSKFGGEIKIMEPEKCDDLRWFPLDELPTNIIPNIKSAIESYKQDVAYSNFL